jgi:hypothetical protein
MRCFRGLSLLPETNVGIVAPLGHTVSFHILSSSPLMYLPAIHRYSSGLMGTSKRNPHKKRVIIKHGCDLMRTREWQVWQLMGHIDVIANTPHMWPICQSFCWYCINHRLADVEIRIMEHRNQADWFPSSNKHEGTHGRSVVRFPLSGGLDSIIPSKWTENHMFDSPVVYFKHCVPVIATCKLLRFSVQWGWQEIKQRVTFGYHIFKEIHIL